MTGIILRGEGRSEAALIGGGEVSKNVLKGVSVTKAENKVVGGRVKNRRVRGRDRDEKLKIRHGLRDCCERLLRGRPVSS